MWYPSQIRETRLTQINQMTHWVPFKSNRSSIPIGLVSGRIPSLTADAVERSALSLSIGERRYLSVLHSVVHHHYTPGNKTRSNRGIDFASAEEDIRWKINTPVAVRSDRKFGRSVPTNLKRPGAFRKDVSRDPKSLSEKTFAKGDCKVEEVCMHALMLVEQGKLSVAKEALLQASVRVHWTRSIYDDSASCINATYPVYSE